MEERRRHEQRLLRGYHEELLALGVRGLSWEQLWEEYRRSCFHGLVMTIAASMVVQRTERGDEMFMTWFERNATQAIDLDAVELLPAASSGPPPPLRPEPEDEGCHEPGPEALWNESWYFDAVSDGRLDRRLRAARAAAEPGRRALLRVRVRPRAGDGDARRRGRAAAGCSR